jgi:hypothetical protein
MTGSLILHCPTTAEDDISGSVLMKEACVTIGHEAYDMPFANSGNYSPTANVFLSSVCIFKLSSSSIFFLLNALMCEAFAHWYGKISLTELTDTFCADASVPLFDASLQSALADVPIYSRHSSFRDSDCHEPLALTAEAAV